MQKTILNFKLRNFSGNPLKWKPFQETHEAATESNNQLSAIEKLSHLRGYLKGTSFQAIEALSPASDNHKHAWALLKERYGNP